LQSFNYIPMQNERQFSVDTSINDATTTPHSMPGIVRISNKASAQAALVLVGAMAVTGGCGGKVTVDGNSTIQVQGETCSPIADCPNPKLSAQGEYENYYDLSGRWRRYDPTTGEQFKVCEPTQRDFCQEGENPQDDGCEPAVCKNIEPCDPIPSRKKDGAAYRLPDRANFPTSSTHASLLPWIYSDTTLYPVIYDNTPDCAPGEKTPDGETYYTCDQLPTCEKTIPYCDPLPRCEEGESPVTCEPPGGAYGVEQDCINSLNETINLFSFYGLDLSPGANNMCEPEWDSSVNETAYTLPKITMNCLPTPECKDGEQPTDSTLTTQINCEKWGSWLSSYTYAPSCDPIESCK